MFLVLALGAAALRPCPAPAAESEEDGGGDWVEQPAPARPEARVRPNHLVPALETAAIIGVTMTWNVTVGAAPWARVTLSSIESNLHPDDWVLDRDRFWINQVAHPYQGIWPFSAARSSGLGFYSSLPYPFTSAVLWEIVGETEKPSVNDVVTTTISGVVLGEAFHRIAGMILEGGRGPGRQIAAFLFGPLETANRAMLGTEPAGPAPPSRVLVTGGVRTFDGAGRAADVRGAVLPEIGVRLDYGVPGDPRFRFARPFDHFEIDASYAFRLDPLAGVFARGVVAGRQFESERHRGLVGVVAGFDFSALRNFRTSTSSVGVSAEDRWLVAPGVALEGTAVASAVLIGAAGYLVTTPDQREYRMGPGAQGELGLELRAHDRIVAGLSARHYLIVGVADSYGSEQITYAKASFMVRLFGRNALGVEGLLARRIPSGPGGARIESGTGLRVYYAFGTPSPTG
jgi:hypothetical protein